MRQKIPKMPAQSIRLAHYFQRARNIKYKYKYKFYSDA